MTILKGLVACLALANLLYFLWTHGVAETRDKAAMPAAPSRTLKLVSESAAPARAAPNAAASNAAVPTAAAPPPAVTPLTVSPPKVPSPPVRDSSGLPPSGKAASAGDVAVTGGATAGLPSSVQHCVTVGPFRDSGQTAHAAATLRAGGFDPRQHAIGKAYWIDVDIKSGDGFPGPAELEGGSARSAPLEVKACPADPAPAAAGAAR